MQVLIKSFCSAPLKIIVIGKGNVKEQAEVKHGIFFNRKLQYSQTFTA